MRPDGGSMFPHKRIVETAKPIPGHPGVETRIIDEIWEPGISIRDYFAAQALQGVIVRGGFLLENLGRFPESTEDLPVFVAELAYEFADAMLAEREK